MALKALVPVSESASLSFRNAKTLKRLVERNASLLESAISAQTI